MFRALARTIVAVAALAGLVSAGWACGLPHAGSAAGGHAAMASGGDMAAMHGQAMTDCPGSTAPAPKADVPQTCVTLCAVTLTIAPSVARQFAAAMDDPHYPAAASIHEWLIQPEPYPPRA